MHSLPLSLSDTNQSDNFRNVRDNENVQELLIDVYYVETEVELPQNNEKPESDSDADHSSHQQPVNSELIKRLRHKQKFSIQMKHPMVTRGKIESA